MSESAVAVRSGVHYLEDLTAGQLFVSAARTVTESDVVAFAGLSGDFNVIHTDAEFARSSVYGKRVVYGLLSMSIATGLLDRLGIFSGSAIAMLGIADWRFTAPVFIGDTIHLELTILAVRPSQSRPDRGVVERRFELVNQHGTVVQAGRIDVLVRRDPHRQGGAATAQPETGQAAELPHRRRRGHPHRGGGTAHPGPSIIPAIYAGLPLSLGLDAGVSWHAGKRIDKGYLATVRPQFGSLVLATLFGFSRTISAGSKDIQRNNNAGIGGNSYRTLRAGGTESLADAG